MDQKPAELAGSRDSSSRVHERRDPQSRERLRQRVRSEFYQAPALVLTEAAAGRLFGIREDICIRVLRELQSEGVLHASRERFATRKLPD
jgi:hypothetical protein